MGVHTPALVDGPLPVLEREVQIPLQLREIKNRVAAAVDSQS